ncbi:unnamed protein product [Litomosoides sigmodontis]|uniref:Leucine-rich repeat-containing protein 59 n=1 Tax=Litomosoides sigmodontis TaxID=42156 RepID=A0A3P6UCL0_LITSI|nr:unnamed protein product [Litomosoides sigmodontis]
MNGEISLKDLKALLDDNNIDLSMHQLVSIPTKSLELPLSFGELASLKWLDLKGNPMELELSQAAGDCLDEKGCKTAALNVVRLMRDRSARQHRLLEKQKFMKKQYRENDAAVHGLTSKKEKTKKKKNKYRDVTYEQLEPDTDRAQQNSPRTVPSNNEKSTRETKRNGKCKSNSVLSLWRKILIILFVLTVVIPLFSAIMVVTNCVGEPQNWLLSSKSFCEDLQTVVEKHSLPPTIFDNFFLSITSLLKPYVDAASAGWETLEKEYDLSSYIKDSYDLLYKKFVSVALLVQGYAAYNYDNLMIFYNTYAADAVNNATKDIWLLLRIFGLMITDLLMTIVGEGCFFVSSIVEKIFTYM